jgi:hypothetical protein
MIDPKAQEVRRNIMLDELKKDYEDVFSTIKGKKVLKDIMLSGVMERSAWDKDPIVMSALCAKQDFARHIAEMSKPTDKVKKQRKAIK